MFIPSWDPSGRTRHFICILKTEGDFSSESSAERRDFADTKSNAERQGSGEAGRVPGQRQAGLQRGCWGEGRRGGDTQGGAGHCCTHTRIHMCTGTRTDTRTHACSQRAHTHSLLCSHTCIHTRVRALHPLHSRSHAHPPAAGGDPRPEQRGLHPPGQRPRAQSYSSS